MKLSELHEELSKFIYESVIDFDLSSLYPSIILAYNISPETCIGKIEIDPFYGEEIGDAEAFVGDFMSGDTIAFCIKWMKLIPPTDIILMIKSNPELEAYLRGQD